MNMDIYEMMFKRYKINKPIRLIELFAGYGSQALALKYLGVKFEHWKISEWAVNSIQAYKDMHFQDDNKDYSEGISKDYLVKELCHLGISRNYNEPMSEEQINRLKEKEIRKIYNNIIATHNLVNIQRIEWEDLEIEDTNEYDYIMTYSFPCQDLSLAGKGKGMKDTSTRSGMLWEVERILKGLAEHNRLPKILLMENVPQVHSADNIKDFNKWQLRLEELGYKNYTKDLIATDYGIPQIRNRCFMISILGDCYYEFPKPIPLELRLKDMLEENVDKKYFLSDRQIEMIKKWNAYEKPLEHLEDELCGTLTTRSGAFASGMKLTYDIFKIPEATKKGYTIATDGDGIYINRPHQKRGVVQKDKIQTLKTNCDDLGVVVGTYQYAKSDNFMNGKSRFNFGKEISDTIQTTQKEGIVYKNLRIRKLSPLECWRLMGIKDEDFEKVRKNQSDSSLYHLAGDSIVVDVLMAIFEQLME